MCGICGIVSHNIESEQIRSMLDSIAHRGPDDEGIYRKEDVFLGHRRLSILDVTLAGHQPMEYKNFVIAFNGEIYNYIEIREELISMGHVFQTKTDTEVILHAYEEWQEQCFQKFRGMWAFALYDSATGKIILSRDRFGIKPLYYFLDEKKLVFGSEVNAVLKGGVLPKANMSTVLRYLAIGLDNNGEDTFFQGIHQLKGSHYAIFDVKRHDWSVHKYYDLKAAITENNQRLSYEQEFIETVRLHLRSDVKIGTCLSGGLDSSTLAAVAKSEIKNSTNEDLLAVTAKSEDELNDESFYAEQVVQACNLKWKIAYPKYEDFVNYHIESLYIQGEPVGSPSVFMQYWVMKEAREAGIKVMLDGQGGDETLLGYERYYISYLFQFVKQLNFIKFIKAYRDIAQNSKLNLSILLQYLIYFSFLPVRKLILKRRLNFIKKEYFDMFLEQNKQYLKQNKNLHGMQIAEIMEFQLPHLLRYEDRNSMIHSVEARVPYVDHKLVENAVKMNFNSKVKNGFTKYCLRKIAEKFLPKSVAWRKNKYGFEAPEEIWLRKYSDKMKEKVEKSKTILEIIGNIPKFNELPLKIRWRLYNLAVWEEQFLKVNRYE